jgi:hypothetical protein
MRRLVPLLLLAALAACDAKTPAAPAAPPPAAAVPAKPADRGVADPEAFVKEVYGKLAPGSDYRVPDDIYTPRLRALWDGMLKDQAASDEVGPIDFEPWTNAQDWRLTDVKVTSREVYRRPDLKVVTAAFKNDGRAEQIRLYFEKAADGWRLDDMRSVGKEAWTLSLLLRYGWDDDPARQ